MSDDYEYPYADEATIEEGTLVTVLDISPHSEEIMHLIGRMGTTVGANIIGGSYAADPCCYAVQIDGEDGPWFFAREQLEVYNPNFDITESDAAYAIRVCGVDPPGYDDHWEPDPEPRGYDPRAASQEG